MIRKYSKLLLLLYAAFFTGHWSVAAGELSDRILPDQSRQLDIDTIVLTTPKPFIADPFNEIIKLYLKTPYPVWGTSDFEDTLIHFSINNTYAWDTGDITYYDPPSKRYDCQSPLPYFFDDTLNHIHFHASYINNNVTYDTVTSFAVRYAKPLVTVLEINDNLYNHQTTVVNSPVNITFMVNINRAYQYVDPEGYDVVIALDARHNGGTWGQVWNNPVGIRDEDVDIPLEYITTTGLIPGYNTIEFRAKGKCKVNCEEFSEIVTIKLFYLDYEAIGPKICREDQDYGLQGIPEGGYFSGDGVRNETNVFNPLMASGGIDTIIYNYLIEGYLYAVPKELEIIELPDFLISGDQYEVCYNSWDVIYTVSSLTGTYDDVNWIIQGGEIMSANQDKSQVSIHWFDRDQAGSENYTGIISVTMEKNGCSVTKEFLVELGNTESPDPSFMILYNKNLLVSDDVSANYFKWYQNGLAVAETDVPYLFLGENFTPANLDEFYVMTAKELCDTTCLTKSNTYVFEAGGKLASDMNQYELPAYPNPNNGNFNILIPGTENDEYLLTIADLTGRIVYSVSVDITVSGREIRINGNDWPVGIYLLRLESHSASMNKKIMITQ